MLLHIEEISPQLAAEDAMDRAVLIAVLILSRQAPRSATTLLQQPLDYVVVLLAEAEYIVRP